MSILRSSLLVSCAALAMMLNACAGEEVDTQSEGQNVARPSTSEVAPRKYAEEFASVSGDDSLAAGCTYFEFSYKDGDVITVQGEKFKCSNGSWSKQ